MIRSLFILSIVTAATVLGDYFLKIATEKSEGVMTGWFAAGAIIYGLLAFGWYFLMRSNSLGKTRDHPDRRAIPFAGAPT